MRDRLAELAKQHVDRMAEQDGSCDFASDVAAYYPLRAIMSMLGVPEKDEDDVLRMTKEFFGSADPEFAQADDPSSSYTSGVQQLVTYLAGLTEERRARPTGDIASVIANSTVDGELLGPVEAVYYYTVLATAGHDTTSSAISGGLEALIRHPEAMRELKKDPSLIPNAVEEMLRWTSPTKGFTRTAAEDYELRGTTISAGEKVLLSFPSANRDEDVFADPCTFDIHRSNANRNLAFGFGKHFCLGAQMARMELRIFFTELLPRLDDIAIDGKVERLQSSLVSGLKHLPVRYTMHC
jgi:cytochrome P450